MCIYFNISNFLEGVTFLNWNVYKNIVNIFSLSMTTLEYAALRSYQKETDGYGYGYEFV